MLCVSVFLFQSPEQISAFPHPGPVFALGSGGAGGGQELLETGRGWEGTAPAAPPSTDTASPAL